MACHHLGFGAYPAWHDWQARSLIRDFASLFVHRQSRCQNSGIRIGQAHPFQHSLHATIFAPATMQGIKHNIRGNFAQAHSEVWPGIHRHHLISFARKCGCAFTPAGQGHFALSRRSAHQYRHFLGCHARLTQTKCLNVPGSLRSV